MDFVSPEQRRFCPEGYLQPFDARAELRQQQSREDADGDHVGAEPHGWTPQQTTTLQREPTVVPQPPELLEKIQTRYRRLLMAQFPSYGILQMKRR